jgi:Raf kinase inhibitor-like YbhB/YbcL family protein
MKVHWLAAIMLVALILTACSAPRNTSEPAPAEPVNPPQPTAVPQETGAPSDPVEAAMPFELTSTAFTQGNSIPALYSCDGQDISPPLAWSDPPAGTQSFALIMDDPDAPVGTWDHWILFNIPANMRELSENLPLDAKNQDPDAIFVGSNSWGRADYGGPCPPSGTHRYFFRLFALDTTISLLPGASKGELSNAMEGHILALTELMGTFTR